MKKTLFLILLSNLILTFSFGQDSYLKNRWNFKVGYSRYGTNRSINYKQITAPNYRIEANYGIRNLIEPGVYFGYSKFESSKINWGDSTIMQNDSPAFFYGINCNFHLLPLFVKEDDFRFDLYLTGKIGGLYIASPTGFVPNGSESEYGLGGGLSFYLWKHLGVYVEYSYGKYFFKDNSKLRYGLTTKF